MGCVVAGLDPKREILGLEEFSEADARWVGDCPETTGAAGAEGTEIGWGAETGNCAGAVTGTAEMAEATGEIGWVA